MLFKQTFLSVSALAMLTTRGRCRGHAGEGACTASGRAAGHRLCGGLWRLGQHAIQGQRSARSVSSVNPISETLSRLGAGRRRTRQLLGQPQYERAARCPGRGYLIQGRLSEAASRRTSRTHSYLIGGHINWRDSQRGLFGVFAGAGDAGGGFGPARRHVVGGVEGQLYWNQFTLYVQGGYDTVVGGFIFDGEPHAWFVRGTGRYFCHAQHGDRGHGSHRHSVAVKRRAPALC